MPRVSTKGILNRRNPQVTTQNVNEAENVNLQTHKSGSSEEVFSRPSLPTSSKTSFTSIRSSRSSNYTAIPICPVASSTEKAFRIIQEAGIIELPEVIGKNFLPVREPIVDNKETRPSLDILPPISPHQKPEQKKQSYEPLPLSKNVLQILSKTTSNQERGTDTSLFEVQPDVEETRNHYNTPTEVLDAEYIPPSKPRYSSNVSHFARYSGMPIFPLGRSMHHPSFPLAFRVREPYYLIDILERELQAQTMFDLFPFTEAQLLKIKSKEEARYFSQLDIGTKWPTRISMTRKTSGTDLVEISFPPFVPVEGISFESIEKTLFDLSKNKSLTSFQFGNERKTELSVLNSSSRETTHSLSFAASAYSPKINLSFCEIQCAELALEACGESVFDLEFSPNARSSHVLSFPSFPRKSESRISTKPLFEHKNTHERFSSELSLRTSGAVLDELSIKNGLNLPTVASFELKEPDKARLTSARPEAKPRFSLYRKPDISQFSEKSKDTFDNSVRKPRQVNIALFSLWRYVMLTNNTYVSEMVRDSLFRTTLGLFPSVTHLNRSQGESRSPQDSSLDSSTRNLIFRLKWQILSGNGIDKELYVSPLSQQVNDFYTPLSNTSLPLLEEPIVFPNIQDCSLKVLFATQTSHLSSYILDTNYFLNTHYPPNVWSSLEYLTTWVMFDNTIQFRRIDDIEVALNDSRSEVEADLKELVLMELPLVSLDNSPLFTIPLLEKDGLLSRESSLYMRTDDIPPTLAPGDLDWNKFTPLDRVFNGLCTDFSLSQKRAEHNIASFVSTTLPTPLITQIESAKSNVSSYGAGSNTGLLNLGLASTASETISSLFIPMEVPFVSLKDYYITKRPSINDGLYLNLVQQKVMQDLSLFEEKNSSHKTNDPRHQQPPPTLNAACSSSLWFMDLTTFCLGPRMAFQLFTTDTQFAPAISLPFSVIEEVELGSIPSSAKISAYENSSQGKSNDIPLQDKKPTREKSESIILNLDDPEPRPKQCQKQHSKYQYRRRTILNPSLSDFYPSFILQNYAKYLISQIDSDEEYIPRRTDVSFFSETDNISGVLDRDSLDTDSAIFLDEEITTKLFLCLSPRYVLHDAYDMLRGKSSPAQHCLALQFKTIKNFNKQVWKKIELPYKSVKTIEAQHSTFDHYSHSKKSPSNLHYYEASGLGNLGLIASGCDVVENAAHALFPSKNPSFNSKNLVRSSSFNVRNIPQTSRYFSLSLRAKRMATCNQLDSLDIVSPLQKRLKLLKHAEDRIERQRHLDLYRGGHNHYRKGLDALQTDILIESLSESIESSSQYQNKSLSSPAPSEKNISSSTYHQDFGDFVPDSIVNICSNVSMESYFELNDQIFRTFSYIDHRIPTFIDYPAMIPAPLCLRMDNLGDKASSSIKTSLKEPLNLSAEDALSTLVLSSTLPKPQGKQVEHQVEQKIAPASWFGFSSSTANLNPPHLGLDFISGFEAKYDTFVDLQSISRVVKPYFQNFRPPKHHLLSFFTNSSVQEAALFSKSSKCSSPLLISFPIARSCQKRHENDAILNQQKTILREDGDTYGNLLSWERKFLSENKSYLELGGKETVSSSSKELVARFSRWLPQQSRFIPYPIFDLAICDHVQDPLIFDMLYPTALEKYYIGGQQLKESSTKTKITSVSSSFGLNEVLESVAQEGDISQAEILFRFDDFVTSYFGEFAGTSNHSERSTSVPVPKQDKRSPEISGKNGLDTPSQPPTPSKKQKLMLEHYQASDDPLASLSVLSDKSKDIVIDESRKPTSSKNLFEEFGIKTDLFNFSRIFEKRNLSVNETQISLPLKSPSSSSEPRLISEEATQEALGDSRVNTAHKDVTLIEGIEHVQENQKPQEPDENQSQNYLLLNNSIHRSVSGDQFQRTTSSIKAISSHTHVVSTPLSECMVDILHAMDSIASPLFSHISAYLRNCSLASSISLSPLIQPSPRPSSVSSDHIIQLMMLTSKIARIKSFQADSGGNLKDKHNRTYVGESSFLEVERRDITRVAHYLRVSFVIATITEHFINLGPQSAIRRFDSLQEDPDLAQIWFYRSNINLQQKAQGLIQGEDNPLGWAENFGCSQKAALTSNVGIESELKAMCRVVERCMEQIFLLAPSKADTQANKKSSAPTLRYFHPKLLLLSHIIHEKKIDFYPPTQTDLPDELGSGLKTSRQMAPSGAYSLLLVSSFEDAYSVQYDLNRLFVSSSVVDIDILNSLVSSSGNNPVTSDSAVPSGGTDFLNLQEVVPNFLQLCLKASKHSSSGVPALCNPNELSPLSALICPAYLIAQNPILFDVVQCLCDDVILLDDFPSLSSFDPFDIPLLISREPEKHRRVLALPSLDFETWRENAPQMRTVIMATQLNYYGDIRYNLKDIFIEAASFFSGRDSSFQDNNSVSSQVKIAEEMRLKQAQNLYLEKFTQLTLSYYSPYSNNSYTYYNPISLEDGHRTSQTDETQEATLCVLASSSFIQEPYVRDFLLNHSGFPLMSPLAVAAIETGKSISISSTKIRLIPVLCGSESIVVNGERCILLRSLDSIVENNAHIVNELATLSLKYSTCHLIIILPSCSFLEDEHFEDPASRFFQSDMRHLSFEKKQYMMSLLKMITSTQLYFPVKIHLHISLNNEHSMNLIMEILRSATSELYSSNMLHHLLIPGSNMSETDSKTTELSAISSHHHISFLASFPSINPFLAFQTLFESISKYQHMAKTPNDAKNGFSEIDVTLSTLLQASYEDVVSLFGVSRGAAFHHLVHNNFGRGLLKNKKAKNALEFEQTISRE